MPLPQMPVCGDQDGSEAPLVTSCPDLEQLSDVQSFTVSGSGQVDITFDFVFRHSGYRDELGFFTVDGSGGEVGDLKPGDEGYLEAALERAVIIFPAGSDPSVPDNVKSVPADSKLVFFIIQDSNLQRFAALNPANDRSKLPLLFASWTALNPDEIDHFIGFQHKTNGSIQFGFENLTDGGDADYDDVVYTVSTVQENAAVVATGSGEQGGDGNFLPFVLLAAIVAVIGASGLVLWRRRATAATAAAMALPRVAVGPATAAIATRPEQARANLNAWLQVEGDANRHVLGEDPVTVGFTPDCSITLPSDDDTLTGRVRIWRREGAYMLHNLSRFGEAGVTVSGRAAGVWTVLDDGDVIELGGRHIIFRAVPVD